MQVHDQILLFLKANGPSLPIHIAKSIKSDTLIASAHLADLSSRSKVKISHLKVGGSPLYYLPGDEEKIYNFAANNINAKNYQVLQRLKQEKVLREIDLPVLAKVALRTLKDFAIPLHVIVGEDKELFWKWHFLSAKETNEIIASLLQPEMPPSVEKPLQELEEPVETQESEESTTDVESTDKLEDGQDSIVEPAASPSGSKKETNKEKISTKKEKSIQDKQTALPGKEIKIKPKPKKQDSLLPITQKFLQNLDIKIISHEIIRKNSEMNLQIIVSSVIGKVNYFCKVKKKARCDEKDLSVAYMEAQIKKLPLLFLYSKDLTKKAKEMLESDAFQNALVKKIE